MGKDALRLSTVLAATPQVVYRAWLDSGQHASFTGASAKIEPSTGGKFSLRDGTITGKNIVVEFGRRLLQSWRTADFPKGAPDARLEVLFESVGAGTRVTIMHSELPEGFGQKLRPFWAESYFAPMTDYFGKFATILANTPPSQPLVLLADDEGEEPEEPEEPEDDDEEDEAPAKKKLVRHRDVEPGQKPTLIPLLKIGTTEASEEGSAEPPPPGPSSPARSAPPSSRTTTKPAPARSEPTKKSTTRKPAPSKKKALKPAKVSKKAALKQKAAGKKKQR